MSESSWQSEMRELCMQFSKHVFINFKLYVHDVKIGHLCELFTSDNKCNFTMKMFQVFCASGHIATLPYA